MSYEPETNDREPGKGSTNGHGTAAPMDKATAAKDIAKGLALVIGLIVIISWIV